MTPCVAIGDELAEVALGEPASEGLSIHLSECGACAGELERQRALVRRIDAAVKAIVRSQPQSRLRENRAWPLAVVGAAFAASVIGVFFGVRALQPPARLGPDVAALVAWHSPTAALLQPHGSILEAPIHDLWGDTHGI